MPRHYTWLVTFEERASHRTPPLSEKHLLSSGWSAFILRCIPLYLKRRLSYIIFAAANICKNTFVPHTFNGNRLVGDHLVRRDKINRRLTSGRRALNGRWLPLQHFPFYLVHLLYTPSSARWSATTLPYHCWRGVF
jgi:hypothetical protein